MPDIKKTVRQLALLNAVKFNGKASPKSILAPLLAQFPDYRQKVPEMMKTISTIVEEINSMPLEKQQTEIKTLGIKEKEKKEKRTGLPELKNAVKGKVVMRFEPSPSGPLHIGHAFTLLLNSEYCRIYNGKMILRISDTNAKNIYPPAYRMIEEDARWLTDNKINKIIIQSDRLELYCRTMEQLIQAGNAYVCTCRPEEFRDYINKKKACPCRTKKPQENIIRWKDMFKKYKEGQAVVRIKTDIKHKNPAMRDWPAFRINEEKHPRTGKKHRVWPLMNFSVAVDDHDFGVTHVIRGKDHITNTERQIYIFDYLNWKKPEFIYIGRINFKGFPVSASKTRLAIEEKKYKGWDDVQIPFIPALRRRGFKPDALRKITIDIGPSKSDKTVHIDEFFKTVKRYNKDIIDHTARRLFFVESPVKINLPDKLHNTTVDVENHPENKILGKREIKIKNAVYITEEDYKKLKEKPVRLRKLADGILKKSFMTTDRKPEKPQVIQWVPEENIKTQILMPDGNTIKGLAEKECKNLKTGDIIQFERFGFCRLDSKTPLVFCFAHK